jgi:hypothetical protein
LNLPKGTTTAEEERITALLKGGEVKTSTSTLMERDSIDEVHHTNNAAGDFTEERILLERKIEVFNNYSE